MQVADSVAALMAVVKRQRVPRLGPDTTVGDLFGGHAAPGGHGGGASAAGHGEGARTGEDDALEGAEAAAALKRSAEWAQEAEEEDADDFQRAAAEAKARRREYATLGVVGEPNMGKSALINRLFRAPVVKAPPPPAPRALRWTPPCPCFSPGRGFGAYEL